MKAPVANSLCVCSGTTRPGCSTTACALEFKYNNKKMSSYHKLGMQMSKRQILILITGKAIFWENKQSEANSYDRALSYSDPQLQGFFLLINLILKALLNFFHIIILFSLPRSCVIQHALLLNLIAEITAALTDWLLWHWLDYLSNTRMPWMLYPRRQ